MSFKFAIWCAVSTAEQADDKESIPNQIRDCRAYGTRLGGVESHKPFIADGYSRSFYEGLEEAMRDIPPLKDAIESAQRGEFDVLICRYFERFGTVAYPVFVRLGKYKKQLRSVQEQTQIYPSELYEVTKDEATSMMIHMSGIKQDYRVNRIVTNLRDSMPRRIKDGLTPGRMPYGYVWTGKKTAPAQDAEKCAKLLQAKDMLFDGETYQAISEVLGVALSNVARTITNPYYCGQVSYNKGYLNKSDNDKRVENPKSKWTTAEGKHQPLWDRATHDAIVSEVERRRAAMQRNAVRYQFSGLLRCGVCGGYVRRAWDGSPNKRRQMVKCRDYGSDHVSMEYSKFYGMAVTAIMDAMRREQLGEDAQEESDKSELLKKALDEKKKKRRKIQEGYESDPPIYSAAEASKLLRELDKETEQIDRDLERIARAKQNKAAASATISLIDDIENIPRWLEHQNVKRVNTLLAAWLLQITVKPDGVEVVKR